MTKIAPQDLIRLQKSVKYYHWALENYAEFVKTERKPRTRPNLQKRLTQLEKEVQAAKGKCTISNTPLDLKKLSNESQSLPTPGKSKNDSAARKADL
jgi:hypothetical protein